MCEADTLVVGTVWIGKNAEYRKCKELEKMVSNNNVLANMSWIRKGMKKLCYVLERVEC